MTRAKKPGTPSSMRRTRDYGGAFVVTSYGIDVDGWAFAEAQVLQNGIELHTTERQTLPPHFLEALEGYGPEVLEEFADEVDLEANEWIERYIF